MSTPRTRLGSYLVATTNGRILLARIAPGYPGAGRWTLPGGGVEWGEHPEDTLRREVHEESGFDLEDFEFLGIDSRVLDETDAHPALHAIRVLYTAHLEGEPSVVEVDGSVDAAAWTPIADLHGIGTVNLVHVGLALLDRYGAGEGDPMGGRRAQE